jgi:hypothetical protein
MTARDTRVNCGAVIRTCRADVARGGRTAALLKAIVPALLFLPLLRSFRISFFFVVPYAMQRPPRQGVRRPVRPCTLGWRGRPGAWTP